MFRKVEGEAQRAGLYQQAETQLDKDSPIVPVYYRVSVRLVKPWVGGFTGKDPQDMTDVAMLCPGVPRLRAPWPVTREIDPKKRSVC